MIDVAANSYMHVVGSHHYGKGMRSSSEQPLVGEEHFMTTWITAAKETIRVYILKQSFFLILVNGGGIFTKLQANWTNWKYQWLPIYS